MVKERLTVLFQEIFANNISAARLQEAKVILDSSSSSQIAATIHDSIGVQVSQFCGFLLTHADDAENGDAICYLFEKILSCLEPMTVVTELEQVLVIGMEHPNPRIREAVLKKVESCFSNASTLAVLSCYTDFLCSIVRCLADRETRVAQRSVAALQMLGQDSETFMHLFNPPLKEVLNETLTRDATVRFRLYDVMVNIASQRASALPLIAEEFSDPLLSELDSGDILLQLNCLQLLSELAGSPHGLAFLKQKGLIDRFESLLTSCNEDPLASFLIPGILKFFGSVGQLRPEELFENHKSVVQFLLSSIEIADPSVLAVTVETLGVLASSVEGKRLLQRTGEQLKRCLRSIGHLLQGGSSEEIKIRILGMLKNMMQVTTVDEQEREEMSSLLESWFSHLHPEPAQIVLSMARQPFPEVHCAALELMASVAPWHWAQVMLHRQPGFIEYLLDRTTDLEKEGKDAKYGIVQALADSPTCSEIFGEEALSQLRQYVREGPIYIRAEAAVALEGPS